MKRRLQDICAQQETGIAHATGGQSPHVSPLPSRNAIHVSTAYRCQSPADAIAVLDGQREGYAYQRDGHPNADALAKKCAELHGAENAVISSTGMSALAVALVSKLNTGDHVALSSRLYGLTAKLVRSLASLGISSSVVDVGDPDRMAAELNPATKMLIMETITNPLLRVADMKRAVDVAHDCGAMVLVDNTFACPVVCRPLEHGADLVMESMTKMMNGHGDVTLGMLCGNAKAMEGVASHLSMWGVTASPFDSWLCERGLSTLYLRMKAASDNAMELAQCLVKLDGIKGVDYPGLESHPDHATAASLLGDDDGLPLFGNMVTFHLEGGFKAADAFIRNSEQVHFVPSLGELTTTVSHPASTSHMGMDDAVRTELGITAGTIRVSTGIENAAFIKAAFTEVLVGLDF